MKPSKAKPVLVWIRENWTTIAALVTAVAAVLWPGSDVAVERILTIIASVLGATGMGMLAARSEARKLGLVPSRRV